MQHLIKFSENCTDEFNICGMMLLTEKEFEEFLLYWEEIADALDEGFNFEWRFGSNESIWFFRSSKWKDAFTFEVVTEKEAEVLRTYLFNEDNYFGLLPEMEFMYDKLEAIRDSREEYEND